MMAMQGKAIRLFLISGVTALMLTQFTNCGFSEMTSATSSSSLECDDDCVSPVLDNLEVSPRLGGGSDFSVAANIAEWNIGGDCNEAGFPYNTIVWELYLNGTKVRDSGMSGMGGATNVNSRCVNGRFMLYMNMSAISSDNVNRTGLSTNGVSTSRAQYDLYIEIFGQETLNGTAQRNTLKARRHVSLLPI